MPFAHALLSTTQTISDGVKFCTSVLYYRNVLTKHSGIVRTIRSAIL